MSGSGDKGGTPTSAGGALPTESTTVGSRDVPERVVAAAHLYLDAHDTPDPRAIPVIVSAPPPARHHNLMIAWHLLGSPDESGFMTSTGRFVGREEALKIALAAGQPLIDHPSRHPTKLFSEDLW